MGASQGNFWTKPINNVIVLVAMGIAGILVVGYAPSMENAGMAVLIIRFVPLFIALVTIMIYLIAFRFKPEKAHLVTVGGVLGLLVFFIRNYVG